MKKLLALLALLLFAQTAMATPQRLQVTRLDWLGADGANLSVFPDNVANGWQLKSTDGLSYAKAISTNSGEYFKLGDATVRLQVGAPVGTWGLANAILHLGSASPNLVIESTGSSGNDSVGSITWGNTTTDLLWIQGGRAAGNASIDVKEFRLLADSNTRHLDFRVPSALGGQGRFYVGNWGSSATTDGIMNVIDTPSGSSVAALVVKNGSFASGNLLEARNSSDTVLAKIDGSGNVTGTNLSGTNTGNVTLAAVGSSPNANGASLSGQALTLQPADGSNPGLLTAGAQTIGGAKTFSSTISASNFSGTHSGTSSGTNTGDQTITLTGDVTGTGTASFATTLATTQSAAHTWSSDQTYSAKTLFTPVTIAAGGTGQSDATDITTPFVNIGSGTGNNGARLPSCTGGQWVFGYNNVNGVKLYPQTGDRIADLTVTTGNIQLNQPGSMFMAYCAVATKWSVSPLPYYLNGVVNMNSASIWSNPGGPIAATGGFSAGAGSTFAAINIYGNGVFTASATHTAAGATLCNKESCTVTSASAGDVMRLNTPSGGAHQRLKNESGVSIGLYPSGTTGSSHKICVDGSACTAVDTSITLADHASVDCITRTSTVIWDCAASGTVTP
jgi:hypothetical protein